MMLELVSIIATATTPENGYAFTARLRTDGGEVFDVAMGIAELRSYAYFQARTLATCGRMYWNASFENRCADASDSEWRASVAFMLERSAKAGTPVSENGLPKNRTPVVN